jgi:hypothetical protein
VFESNWHNSIKFYSNSKIRYEFDFSSEFYWSLVKVFTAKVMPIILPHLQKKFNIFRRRLGIFPEFLKTSVLYGNLFQKL